MNFIRRHLSYANVVSTICLFLVLGGATAFAAKQLAKNSVGTTQLKKNAVTAVKLKDGAVTGAKLAGDSVDAGKIANGAVTAGALGAGSVTAGKLADGSVGTGKLADNSVTAAKIDPGLLGGAHVVARVRGAGRQTLFEGASYTLTNPTFTQAAGEDDFYVGAATVTVPAACAPPRNLDLKLAVDAAIVGLPNDSQVIGTATLQDGGVGAITRLIKFGPFRGAMAMLAPDLPLQHTVSISGSFSCGPDSEAPPTIESGGVDVVGIN